MEIKQFEEWIITNRVVVRTLEGFWENYESYKIEEPEEYSMTFGDHDLNDLLIEVSKISLNLFDWPESNNYTISANIPILCKKKNLGYYELIFALSGDIIDDYFVTYINESKIK